MIQSLRVVQSLRMLFGFEPVQLVFLLVFGSKNFRPLRLRYFHSRLSLLRQFGSSMLYQLLLQIPLILLINLIFLRRTISIRVIRKLLGCPIVLRTDLDSPLAAIKDRVRHLFQTLPHSRGSTSKLIDFMIHLIFFILDWSCLMSSIRILWIQKRQLLLHGVISKYNNLLFDFFFVHLIRYILELPIEDS